MNSIAYQMRLTPDLQDLNPILAGYALPTAANSKSPDPHSYTLIHYVTSGRGIFFVDGKEYDVHTGQAFLILPGEGASYIADPDDPWSFRWVGFNGKLAHQFSQLPPVFNVPPIVLDTMCDLRENNIPTDVLGYRIAAELMLLYSTLLEPSNKKPDYVHLVMEHIRNYSHQKISIANIASSLNLNRCYLSDLFKKKTGMSIQQYLLKARIENAKRHLLQGSSIKEAALQSGFSDVSNFNKHFIKEVGATPTRFRKNAIDGTARYHNNK